MIYFIRSFIFFFALVALTSTGYYFYTKNTAAPTEQTVAQNEDFNDAVDTTLTGTLFFSGRTGTTTYPQIYTHNFGSGEQTIYADLGAFSYNSNQGHDTYGLMIAWVDDIADIDSDGFVPVWHNKQTKAEYGVLPLVENVYAQTDIVTAPDNIHYAYSYQPNEVTSLNINDWNIALHNYETGSTTIIEGATEPTFTDTADLVYMKTDSFYRYTPANRATEQIITPYENFSILDDYVLENNTLILTLPSIRTLSVQTLTDQVLTETRTITKQDSVYRHPVLSPDGRFFAVMAAKDQNLDLTNTTNTKYSAIDAEVHLTNVSLNEPITTITFPGFVPESVRLEGWE